MIAFIPPTTGLVVLAGIVAMFVFEFLRIKRSQNVDKSHHTKS